MPQPPGRASRPRTAPAVRPPKPCPGDEVAVVSPSRGLPGDLPLPYELGLRRLREDFGLRPVEYPTTRGTGADAQARARDVNAAFADPRIKALIASVGGWEQITVLRHLDRDLIRANPKPFFGYSDNTNLLLFLRALGIVSYHGGMVMTQYGRPGALHPVTAHSLRAALFGAGEYELPEVGAFSETSGPWTDPATFATEPPAEPADPWFWHNPHGVVEGAGWGGDLEIVSWLLMANLAIGDAADYAGGVFFMETADSMPSAESVYVILRSLGERGILGQFSAVLVGRPKTWSRAHRLGAPEKARFRRDQRAAVLRALSEYAPDSMAVFNVDFGHTDPQVVLPCGGRIRVDGPRRKIVVTY
ncbi:LD-carboxypeptidase [Streptomyces sp. SL13]|uniref:LD-carboxypeptidase n=1 Tax=Streptantibioticus silvisoli TaxID=2705255 RepID=A0AA90JXE2_9ACTN|nr:S66 peptidase family protein [Streptantibioticus silvisoli]MDI5963961.1 LD-carboxypeptidase [Streptantibioticus silvisoli]MDI5970076.1 LD-carboxypeptidase [Streptantibioticus silvisoli]